MKNLASPSKVMLENDLSLNKIIHYHASQSLIKWLKN